MNAMFGRDGVEIDLEIAHDALDDVAPQPVGAEVNPRKGRETIGSDRLGVSRRSRRVLDVAMSRSRSRRIPQGLTRRRS
jgi:hypothetical protein